MRALVTLAALSTLLLPQGCAQYGALHAVARIRVSTDLELSFKYPASWTYERDGDMLVFKAGPGPDASIPTLFVQTRRVRAAWDLSREVSKILKQHRETVQSKVTEEGWGEIQGSPVFKFRATFYMNQAPYEMLQAILARAGHFFYISLVASASSFAQGESAFNTVMKTLHFGKPAEYEGKKTPKRRDYPVSRAGGFKYGYLLYLGLALAVIFMVALVFTFKGGRTAWRDIVLDLAVVRCMDQGGIMVLVTVHNLGKVPVTLDYSNLTVEFRRMPASGSELVEVEELPVSTPTLVVPVSKRGRLAGGESKVFTAVVSQVDGEGAILARARLKAETGPVLEKVTLA